MAQPRAYTRQANFTDHTTESPSDPQVGSKLDSEFDAINLTINDIRTNLAVLQRDDTKVANLAIHAEALSTAVLALIKATENGYGVKGAWAASTAYVIGDLVDSSSATYLCHTAHTSGSTFAANSSKFILLANAAIQTTASAVDTLDGDGSSTAFTLSSNTPSGVTDVLVFVNGSLQTPTTHYTISGTTITFTTAPSSGTNNIIVWGTSTAVEAAKAAALAAQTAAQTAESNAETAEANSEDSNLESEQWATKLGAVVNTFTSGSENSDGTLYSSKEHATGTTAESAKSWATKTGGDVPGGSSGDKSAKSWASETGVSAPVDGSAKEWATEDTDVVVADSEYSARHYAAKSEAAYVSFTGIYKTGATDPFSSKDVGDLWYDTTGSALKVWSGSAWSLLDTLPQGLDTTDTPTFATPTESGHAATRGYVLTAQAAFDDSKLRNDIATLALHSAITDNKVSYNLSNSFIDHFEDDLGIDVHTSTRKDSTEFISTLGQDSTAAGGNDSATVLLLTFDGAVNNKVHADSSVGGAHGTATNVGGYEVASQQGVYRKFTGTGEAGGYFDGSSYLRFAHHADWDFGDDPWTIDFWIRTEATGSSQWFNHTTASQGAGWYARKTENFWGSTSGSALTLSGGIGYSANVWTHIAYERVADGTLYRYRDGSLIETSTSSTGTSLTAQTESLTIGANEAGGEGFVGYMDEFRISTVARYGGTGFTVRTAAYLSSTIGATGNFTCVTQTASATVSKMGIVVIYKDGGSSASTLNTDLIASVSANGGTNYQDVTLTAAGTFSIGIKIAVANDLTITNTGTTPKYKISFANQGATKETQIHGVALLY